MSGLPSQLRNGLKFAAYGLLGKDRTQSIAAKFRRRPFSEAELVVDYFRGKKDSGTMIDVGAHYGESFAPYLSLGWRVLAFEPDPLNRSKLLEKKFAGDLNLLPCAVSDKEIDDAPFYSSSESTGISALAAFRPTHSEAARVKVTTLRKVLEQQNIPRVDFLKIDTEGHDFFVLKGFPWERTLPEVVLCEFEDFKTLPLGYGVHDLGRYLLERHYSVFLSEWYPVVRYGDNHRWRSLKSYPTELADPKAWGNFIAARSPHAIEYLMSRAAKA